WGVARFRAEHRGFSPGRMSCAVRADTASIWWARHGRRPYGVEESIRGAQGLSRAIHAGSLEWRRVLTPDYHRSDSRLRGPQAKPARRTPAARPLRGWQSRAGAPQQRGGSGADRDLRVGSPPLARAAP